jgi:hypothetical protein
MGDLPGTHYDDPIWHRGFRIWLCHDEQDRALYAWASEDADLDDPLDRRHGDAPTIQQARADIDDYLGCQEFNAEQRAKGPAALVDLYSDLEAAGRGGMK